MKTEISNEKHSWALIVPLNKRGVILWNHLKENKKYIKYFNFDDVNAEYYNLTRCAS